jgi:hypothetical protein
MAPIIRLSSMIYSRCSAGSQVGGFLYDTLFELAPNLQVSSE